MSENAADKKSVGRTSRLAMLCLIFLIVPNFNVFDILPDFVAYIVLARKFGKYTQHVPYFAEARDAFVKLAAVTIIKIPASFIMLSNMYTGKDIVPLFTLVFVSLELILLFPAIKNSFLALYYVGERGDCPSLITPFTFAKRSIRPETLERLTILFFAVKGVFNFIPDTFLMSQNTTDAELQLRAMFPVATVTLMTLVLLLGIVWLLLMRRYVITVAKEGKLHSAIMGIAGEEKLARIDKERSVRSMITSLTVLFFGSLLCFDVSFAELFGGVNLLPHFLFALVLIWFAGRHFDLRRDRLSVFITGAVYSVASVYAHYLGSEFLSRYRYTDIDHLDAARDAYTFFEIMTVVETLLMLLLCCAFALGFASFLKRHTLLGIAEGNESLPDRELSKKMRAAGLVLSLAPALISLLKCAEVFIKAEVRYLSTDIESGLVAVSVMPWFGFLIIGVCVAYVFFCYYFLNEVKSEIKMKYSDEEHTFE